MKVIQILIIGVFLKYKTNQIVKLVLILKIIRQGNLQVLKKRRNTMIKHAKSYARGMI